MFYGFVSKNGKIVVMDTLLFQYCQKIIVLNSDCTKVLLAKRQGEQDYDGIYTFIGGKLETTDGGFIEGLYREKNEEIGVKAQVSVLPAVTRNVYFQKKDGNHMILPHYAAIYSGGEITINEEYSDFAWVDINRLEEFEPKIENIPYFVDWARKTTETSDKDEWVSL